jgi:hypothetical protein
VRTITDSQRRARLGNRHALAVRAPSVEEAVKQMTCLHATEPASVYLSVVARAEASREDIDRALYSTRTVVKQLAMRRTLFAFPRDLLPAVWGSASARVTAQLEARLAKEAVEHGLAPDGPAWVDGLTTAVLQTLRRDGPATTAELRERVPGLAARLELSPGKAYGGSFPVAPRMLGALAASGRIVRGDNTGGWHLSRSRWTLTEDWLGEPVRMADPDSGYRTLVARWLRTFGPGTEADLVWWLGATKGAVRRALAELGTVEVRLEAGTGHLLPDDLDDDPEPAPWAALLPVLDPTVMGWRQRDFHLPPEHVPMLFDRNGNAGSTAWWNGRVVGCWVQDPDGVVVVELLDDVGVEGHRVGTVYPSALMRQARP